MTSGTNRLMIRQSTRSSAEARRAKEDKRQTSVRRRSIGELWRMIGIVSVLSVAAPAQAGERESALDFRVNVYADLPVIAVSGALWAVPSAMDASNSLDMCAPTCDPQDVNSWDRRVIPNHSSGAKRASDVLVVSLPLQALWLVIGDGLHLGAEDAVADTLILTEVLAVSNALNQLVKSAVERPRPYMYREDDGSGLRKDNADDYRSFYSMHTNTVFAVLTGTAVIFSLRYPSHPFKWFLWTAALAGGATVAALRVLAGKHFFTDVITGAVTGIASGIAIPASHLRRRPKPLPVEIAPSGLGVAGSF